MEPNDSDGAAAGGQEELRKLYDRSVVLEQRGVTLSKLHNLQQLRRNRGQLDRAARARRFVLIVVIGAVAFYVKSIYFSVFLYPALKAWWKSARGEKRRYAAPGSNIYALARDKDGLITNNASDEVLAGTSPEAQKKISAYQIATTVDYPPVSALLNLLLVWTDLKPVGATFLLEVINHFEKDRRGVLNLLHFQGAFGDYMPRSSTFGRPHQLVGEVANGALTADGAWTTWRRSGRNGNIWVELFPDTQAAFTQVPVIKEMIGSVPDSNTPAQLDFARLMDGGLVAVAASAAKLGTGISLFNRYFGAAPQRLRGDCSARRADGAMNGAMALGMTVPGMGIASGTATGAVFSAMMAVGGAVAGAIIGGNSAGESCESI